MNTTQQIHQCKQDNLQWWISKSFPVAAAAGVEAGLEEARVFPRVVLNMADIVGGSSVDGGSKTGLKREVSEDVGI